MKIDVLTVASVLTRLSVTAKCSFVIKSGFLKKYQMCIKVCGQESSHEMLFNYYKFVIFSFQEKVVKSSKLAN